MNFLISLLPALGKVFGFNIPSAVTTLLPDLIDAAPQLQAAAQSGEVALNKLLADNPKLMPIIKKVGSSLFPDVAAALQPVAAVQALYDPDYVKQVQALLNAKTNAGLAVDGILGNATKGATKAFQSAHQPAAGPVDGWPGPKTLAALQNG